MASYVKLCRLVLTLLTLALAVEPRPSSALPLEHPSSFANSVLRSSSSDSSCMVGSK